MDEDFPKRLVQAREAAGLSQRAAAERTERMRGVRSVSNASIGDYEIGMSIPGADVLLALARAYGVSPTWLLTGRGIREWDPDSESANEQRQLLAYMRTVGGWLQRAADAGVDVVGEIERGVVEAEALAGPDRSRGGKRKAPKPDAARSP